jgi:putative dimethyl sulfoxide reductase chaperone
VESQETQKLVGVNENRKAIYSFLVTVYARELTRQFLLDLGKRKDFFRNLADDPETKGTELAEGFAGIADFAEGINSDNLERIHLEQAAEYAGLFLGVRQIPPHPSESVYVSTDHMTMQKPRDDALSLYKSMGLERLEDFTEPEDHIALELQFMAYLSNKTTEAIKAGNASDARKYLDVQRDFLNDHLEKWVPKLVDDILKSGRRPFYIAVAKVTREFVAIDKEIVSELIEQLPRVPKPGTE